MTEAVSSFLDNLKQKSTNPFFGTLILVYLIRNWELLYTLFIFDDECTMNDKKHYIYNYIHVHSNDLNIFYNAGIALLAYLIGLAIMVGTRFIVDWKDDTITPWLESKALHDKVVRKERLNAMTNERNIFLDDLIKERERFSKVELDNRTLRETISENSKTFNELSNSNKNLLKTNTDLTSDISNLNIEFNKLKLGNNENIDLTTAKIRQIEEFLNLRSVNEDSVNKLYLKLSHQNLIGSFRKITSLLFDNYSSAPVEIPFKQADILKNMGILNKVGTNEKFNSFNIYLTNNGITLYQLIKLKDENGEINYPHDSN